LCELRWRPASEQEASKSGDPDSNKNLLPIQQKVFAVKGWIHNLSNTEQISDLLGIIDEVSLPELSESMKNLCHVYVQQVLAVR
jgi:hypothetical protein